MFLKLLKYDLLHGKNGFFCLAAALLTVSAVFRFTMDFFQDSVIPMVGGSIVTVVTHIVVGIMSVIFIYQGFAKTFFGDHGYLMFTLPVKKSLLLFTKVGTSLLWLNFMVLAAMGASTILTLGHTDAFTFDQMGIVSVFAFVHYNVLGFLALSILFLIISISKSIFNTISIHFVFAAMIGAAYFALWAQVVTWFYRHVADYGQFGFGVGQGFNFFTGEPMGYLVHYDFFLLGSAVMFGLAACLVILKVFKYMELK